MIALIRQYLPTLIVLCAGLFWNAPPLLIAVAVLVAALVDFILVGPSAELALYRAGLDFDAAAPRQVTGREALRLHLLAMFGSAVLVLVPYASNASGDVQQAFSMAALMVGSATASYSGLLMYPMRSTPRELLERVDVTPDPLVFFDLLPTPARRVIGVVLRIVLGLAAMLPFIALVGFIDREPFKAPMLLIVPALAAFFQLGFWTWLAGLFLLRWVRSRGRPLKAG